MGLGACGLLIIHQICSRAEMHPGLQLTTASHSRIYAFGNKRVILCCHADEDDDDDHDDYVSGTG